MSSPMRGIVRPDEADLRFWFADPEPSLADVVQRFWHVEWDLERVHHQAVLPHPSVNLTFGPFGSRITGVTRGRYTERLEGADHVLGIRFRPGGFRGFLGAPISTITGRRLSIPDVFGVPEQAIEKSVRSASTPADMVEAATEFLLAHRPPPDPRVDEADRAVWLIREHPEITRVEDLAGRLEANIRVVQRLFHDYVGVGPKWVIRLYRMHEAMARSSPDTDWAGLALQLGYSDQAHFVRDFTALVGSTPTRFAQEQRTEGV